jgi:hypothetical protein
LAEQIGKGQDFKGYFSTRWDFDRTQLASSAGIAASRCRNEKTVVWSDGKGKGILLLLVGRAGLACVLLFRYCS